MDRTPFFHSLRLSILQSTFARADDVVQSLGPSGRVLFWIFAVLIIGSSVAILLFVNNYFLVTVPERGGELTEGVVGTPRFINPVLAASDTDLDLTELVYSGLLRPDGHGNLVPDLAKSYDLSPDGRTYTVHLRPDARFQDGSPVTSADVAFTIEKVLDPELKSPLAADWAGVVVTEPDAHTVVFELPQPYAPFLTNLTIGILPKHLWQNVSDAEFSFSSLNTSPVGSGPYAVASIKKDASGAAEAYNLTAFSQYALGAPYITNFTLAFYDSESGLAAAIQSGTVDAAGGISPADLPQVAGSRVLSVPLNRVFGVFFDQNNNPALQMPEVRAALSEAVDRKAIINSALGGYATPLNGPLPPALALPMSSTTIASSTATSTSTDPALAARATLLAQGWTPGPDGTLQKTTKTGKNTQTTELSFSLSTSNVPELIAVADALQKTWAEVGAKVDVQVYDQGDLSENIIQPRKYDALLFGEIVNQGVDLFAFWDSSQRNDPGLNIAMYANLTVDSILQKLRDGTDASDTPKLYAEFQDEIEKDNPAVFLYAPDYLYIVPENLKGVSVSSMDSPSDRFDTVEDWYLATNSVWRVFAR
ncbi:MAG: ABC transporter substrate-binding protein [Minisyncoccia bacterium]